MNYKESKAHGELEHFISYFWTYEHLLEDVEYTILPDACFDLIADFEYGVLQNIHLTGVWTKPVKVVATKGSTLLAVRFKVAAAECLFRREIKSLLNSMTELPLNHWKIDEAVSADFEGFINIISEQMAQIMAQQPAFDPRKLLLFKLIYSGCHQSVGELSDKVGWSSRQINRYFSRQYGFSLKTLLSIVRCKSSYKNIASGELYPRQEYTDQSHYIKEVKMFTECSPGELHKNENDRFLQLSVLKAK